MQPADRQPTSDAVQDPVDQHDMSAMGAQGWVLAADANAFIGRNVQIRRYADLKSWESQNWLMATASRGPATRQFSAELMLSLEPFTMHDGGSPQLFQTGESFDQRPLVNFQHPHDLLMGLGATYKFTHQQLTYIVEADLVGSATLGPPVFMHRASARDNPQVPLLHHYLDSTHITPGVVRGGFGFGSWLIEASAFRGQEPDENRTNIEQPQLDSWAARVGWSRGPWSMQFSGGHLKQPEWWEPFDTTRLTASISYEGAIDARPLAMTLAWGENRQSNGINGNVDGFLLEGNFTATNRSTVYGRVEAAGKEILGVGPHTRQDLHAHWISDLRVFTLGYIRDLVISSRVGRFGVGADATLYRMSQDIVSYYGGSSSYHFFLRWRPTSTSMSHHHGE
jgi:hypothetical protein